uniref:Pentatricopeptide repeat-containing protein n=1 Tax=Arundo donax TaxID=35708 RepID=A0A0A9E1P0_ARUDO
MLEVGLEPRHLTYNTIISGFCEKGDIKSAQEIRSRMEKNKKRANVVTYNVLLNYFCRMGKMEEANELLNEILEKGLVPNGVTYEIINAGMIEKGFMPDIRGYVADASKNLTSS